MIRGPVYEKPSIIILTREQDRRLRAQAWRHVRRINARIAREVYAKARARG